MSAGERISADAAIRGRGLVILGGELLVINFNSDFQFSSVVCGASGRPARVQYPPAHNLEFRRSLSSEWAILALFLSAKDADLVFRRIRKGEKSHGLSKIFQAKFVREVSREKECKDLWADC